MLYADENHKRLDINDLCPPHAFCVGFAIGQPGLSSPGQVFGFAVRTYLGAAIWTRYKEGKGEKQSFSQNPPCFFNLFFVQEQLYRKSRQGVRSSSCRPGGISGLSHPRECKGSYWEGEIIIYYNHLYKPLFLKCSNRLIKQNI